MIGTQRHQHTVVIRFIFQNLVVHLQCLFQLSVHHQRLTIQSLIITIVGEFLSQSLYLGNSRFLVSLTGIYLALGYRQAFALAIDGFDTVQHLYGRIEIAHLLIQLEQHLQQVLTLFVALIDLLHYRNGSFVILLTDVRLCQCFHIGSVIRIECSRLLDICQTFLAILQGVIVLCQKVVRLGGIGIYLQTMTQQIKGCIVVTLLALHHGFKKELVVLTLSVTSGYRKQ